LKSPTKGDISVCDFLFIFPATHIAH